MINPKLIGGGIGASIGAYSQTGDDSYGTDMAGAAIGGAAGYYSVYDNLPKFNLKNKSTSLKYKVDATDSYSDLMNKTMENLDNRLSKIEGLRKRASDSFKKGYAGIEYTDRANSLTEILNHNLFVGAGLGDPDEYVSTIYGKYSVGSEINAMNIRDMVKSGTLTEEQLRSISQASGFSQKIVGEQDLSSIGSPSQRMSPINIPAGRSERNKLDIISNHYSTILGHTKERAEEKARILVGAMGHHDLTLDQYGLTASDGSDRVRYPLTGYSEDGLRYSYSGNTKVVSKQFNAMGRLYLDGREMNGKKVTHEDVLRGSDPEEILMYQGRKDITSLKQTKSMLDKFTEYVGEDALSTGDKSSALGRIKSSTIELGMALDFNSDNELIFRKLTTVGEGTSKASEASKIVGKLAQDAKYDAYERMSINSVTQVISPEAAGNWSIGAFPTEEAGASRVNFRGQLPLDDGDFGENIMKSEYIKAQAARGQKGAKDLLDSSVQGYRIDASSDIGKISSMLYGSDVTLGDGYSLYNEKYASSLAGTEAIKTVIPNLGSAEAPKFNTTLDFASIKELIDSGEGFKLDQGIYGYDGDGAPLKLGKQHSFAYIDSIKNTPEGIELSGKGIYMPGENDIVKVFGTASKSGGTVVDERTFSKIAIMSALESEGKLRLNKDGSKVSFLGKSMLFDDLDKHLEKGYDSYMKKYDLVGKSFMISRAEDSGLGDIQEILAGRYNDNDFAKKYGGIGQDNYVKEFMASNSRNEKANIARLMMAVTDNKGNADVWQTAGEHLTRTGQVDRLAQLEAIKGAMSSPGAQINMPTLKNIISEAYKDKNVFSNTTVTANVGPAISGAGNTGSISWLEQSKLMMDGLSKEDIRSMGKVNQAAVMEVQMLIDSTESGSIDPNKLKSPNSLSDILNKDTSLRAGILEKAGAKLQPGKQHATYNLSEEILGMKSIPIALADTGYAGTLNIGGEDVVKTLDKKRAALMVADLSLRDASGKHEDLVRPLREQYNKAAEDLSKTYQKIGPRLAKKATKLEAIGSKIQWAKPAGGMAQRYVDLVGGNANSAHFMSRNNALNFLKDAGMIEGQDFTIEDVNKKGVKGISKIMLANGLPFMNQTSREPVQGPGTSIASEMLIDDSIRGGKDSIHFANMANEKKAFMSINAAMDFDGDPIRVLPIKGMSPEKMARLKANNSRVVRALSEISDVVKELSPKGSEKKAVSMVGKSPDELRAYNTAAGLKGRYRKPIAPLATGISVDFQEAINNSSLSEERKIQARELAHSLSENMLKSKHRDTLKFLEKPNGVIEGLLEAQNKWLAKDGGDEGFRNSLRGFLDESLGGKIMGSGDNKLISKYTQMREDLINSYANSSTKKQLSTNWSLMDISGEVYDKDRPGIRKMVDAIKTATMEGGGVGPLSETIESEDAMENLAHKSKTVYNEVKSGIVDFASKNKSKLLPAALGLGAIAMLSGTRAPEQHSSTQPTTGGGPRPLEPLRDRKAYTRKYKTEGDNYNAVASVKSSAENVQRNNLNRVLYGDMVTNAQINITDRSGIL